MITYFKNFADTKNPYYVSVDNSLDRIKEGKVKGLIEKIRNEKDPKIRKSLKEKLPCILFSGKFDQRSDAGMITHSGLAVIDFDHVDVLSVKSKLKTIPWVYSYFTSPSGDGVKALIKIPANKQLHRKAYVSAISELNFISPIDSTSQNESRICFESYDPDIYINKNAVEYIPVTTEKKKPEVKQGRTNYKRAAVPVEMVRAAPDGEKHIVLLKAAKLMGGMIAGGIVDENDGYRLLEDEIFSREIDDKVGAKKTIKDGIEYGKENPIEQQQKTKYTPKKIIVSESLEWVSKEDEETEYLAMVRDGTLPIGLSTGFDEFDKYFRFKSGNLVIVNGHDNVGKSSLLWYLAAISNYKHKWKWILFCAENSVGQVRKTLMQFKVGKPLAKMNDIEYREVKKWAFDNFAIIKCDETYTCRDVLRMGELLMEKETYKGFLIDPYNSLALELNGMMNSHEYDYQMTGEMRVFCKKYDASIYLNCHAVTEALRRTFKDGQYAGYPMPPGKADTEGGGKFANRADDFITIHRLTQHPDEFMITQIHIRKIKEMETGGMPTPRDEPFRLRFLKDQFGFFTLDEIPFNPLTNKEIKVQESMRRISAFRFEEENQKEEFRDPPF